MKTHEERLFRVPLEELRALLQSQHDVDLSGVEPYIAGDHLVFAVQVSSDKSNPTESAGGTESSIGRLPRGSGIRRTRRKRNRIKTRGWKVVGKIKNSQGLVANIYEPFVTALKGGTMTRAEQQKAVREIIVRNSNHPTEESVDYYLENTLEYLSLKKTGAPAAPGKGAMQ